ncbi:MAG: rhodanese-like domain-containing protein, partial [Betaproteobacteria bacterium]|nr:rhodanese-like domain-containing protein [Betaproteobacteria bacterium]
MEAFFHFLQKDPFNMMLFGGAVATGIMLLWPLLVKPFRAGREVSVFEAVQLINRKDAVVIDVRDTGEYEAGHLANAKHVAEKQLTDR